MLSRVQGPLLCIYWTGISGMASECDWYRAGHDCVQGIPHLAPENLMDGQLQWMDNCSPCLRLYMKIKGLH
jgi:hypothetical protein